MSLDIRAQLKNLAGGLQSAEAPRNPQKSAARGFSGKIFQAPPALIPIGRSGGAKDLERRRPGQAKTRAETHHPWPHRFCKELEPLSGQ